MRGNRFQADVRLELKEARMVFPERLHSAHEAYAVMKEELEEVWDEVKLKPNQRTPGVMYWELVQLAAMAQRTAEDVLGSAGATGGTKP